MADKNKGNPKKVDGEQEKKNLVPFSELPTYVNLCNETAQGIILCIFFLFKYIGRTWQHNGYNCQSHDQTTTLQAPTGEVLRITNGGSTLKWVLAFAFILITGGLLVLLFSGGQGDSSSSGGSKKRKSKVLSMCF